MEQETTPATVIPRRAGRSELYAWQLEPCPAWCDGRHDPSADAADRDHTVQVGVIPMRLARPVDFGDFGSDTHDWRPPRWHVYLRQPDGGGRFTVHMFSDDVDPMVVLDLRMDEARQLGEMLTSLDDVIR